MADPSSQDVDEFVWVEEADMGIPLEKFSEVFNLLRRGNRAFREKRFEEAISYYSKALPLKPQDPVILGNRSAAFCRTSQLLKDRSARDSEYQPLNGLDPTTHAELALKDAEKVIRVHCTSPKAYFLKANALVLLEQYEEARETILSGLQIDPMSNLLQTYLQEIDRVVAGSVKRVKHWKPERTDDLECTLCFKLLYEPVTTPCGHSFCRSCLHQSMDHGNKCPMCRRVLFISPRTYPISVTLNNIIQKSFPEEYAERKSEQESLTHLGVDIMPLFVMDVVLPCQKISLNIFEPRYRLMVRRIMEGNRRMGMVAVDPATGSIADFACEVEILECEPLPDGRFYLEVEGQRRFRILRSWDQDGYRVAEVEWIWDTLPPKDSQEKEDLMQMTIEAAELTKAWFKRARESMRIGRRSRQLEHFEAEGVPKLDNPERFSFWLINLLNIRPSERLELLRLQDTSKRISHGLISLQAEEQEKAGKIPRGA
ncbi:LON peptidase N-terminal domain and RING finger protein 1-like isoform X1 [Zingiber officinale]|uniref:LON peptidase N-terminal domain and RING finger protein 1-like isoform X1 n=1 Tax=Zingiber officinale TaxID=94328 RepID=UPI001C4AD061|nr:LON peptidase N-terminal domain and RING finger protein 1-like isoform X1 [Zingiber officinale]XP_042436150.1 LON peptidase N-terminal domain and RING finger protein 1-like isoform X1 [Zingiber officinale]